MISRKIIDRGLACLILSFGAVNVYPDYQNYSTQKENPIYKIQKKETLIHEEERTLINQFATYAVVSAALFYTTFLYWNSKRKIKINKNSKD